MEYRKLPRGEEVIQAVIEKAAAKPDKAGNLRVCSFLPRLFCGPLKEIKQFVQDNGKLAVCHRGSYANIYYRGHSILKFDEKSGIFDFNHARYEKNYQDILQRLINSGVQINGGNTAKVVFNGQTLSNIKEILNTFIYLVDSFIKTEDEPALARDYFKGEGGVSLKKTHLERRVEQDIFRQNFKNPDFFVFDMEYAQARNSNAEKNCGRFDMQGLQKAGENTYRLVLIELKSTKGAVNGKSGIDKHILDLTAYIADERYRKTRIADAQKIMEANEKLFCVGWRPEYKICDEVKKLFIFTDEAVGYARNERGKFYKQNLLPADEIIYFTDGDYTLKEKL